jgi:Uncharacterized conserved protein
VSPRLFSISAAVFSALVLSLPLSGAAHAQEASGQMGEGESHGIQAWEQSLQTWREEHEKQVSSRDGWLTLAGLDWLKSGVNSIGSDADCTIRLPESAPAHLALLTVQAVARAAGDSASESPVVQLLSPSGGFPEEFMLEGKPAREGSLELDGTKQAVMSWHNLSFAVMKRGDRFVLRIKDADSPLRANFHGLNWFPPDPAYRVTARWVPFKPPIVQEISTVIGTTLQVPTPGLAMFLLNGQVLQLEPVLEDPAGKSLFFILRDGTSKSSTYGGGRFLHTGLPDHGLEEPGSLVLDFNRLENPPCAYTSYATCPLPPSQNQLEVELNAGEKRFGQ